jgi:hypothetical protein
MCGPCRSFIGDNESRLRVVAAEEPLVKETFCTVTMRKMFHGLKQQAPLLVKQEAPQLTRNRTHLHNYLIYICSCVLTGF